jgi:hypothetical protein
MSRSATAPRVPRTRRVVAGLLLSVVVTGCGAGARPATATPSAEAASPTAPAGSSSPSPGPAGSPSPPPASPAMAEPPDATLTGIASGAGVGALGSFTWDGAGTDAPWIVPADASRAAPGSALVVAFRPAGAPTSWTARWAPVTAAGAGDVASGVEGTGPAVAITAPGEAGAWALQLQASFGQGRSGTWYWRLDVAP